MILWQLLASAILVAAVLFFMWRLPPAGEGLLPWAPPLALLSAWSGLIALVVSLALWILPYPDRWLTALFLALDPAAVGSGTLVLWLYRGHRHTGEQDGAGPADPAAAHRMQAKVGLSLGLAAIVAGYIFVMTHKTPFTPVG